MVNVGIIGAGRIGQVHMNSILTRVPNAKIKAVADPFLSEEADKKAKEYVVNAIQRSFVHQQILIPQSQLKRSKQENMYFVKNRSIMM